MIKYDEAISNADPFTIYIEEKEVEGYFTNARVDRDSLPVGKYAYDLREGEDGEICAIEETVIVNHAGTFLCSEPIDLGPENRLLLGEGEENDYSF